MKPISPDKVPNRPLPDFVIEVFNILITRNMRGRKAEVAHEEVIKAILPRTIGGRDQVVRNGWLDVGDAYREAGWVVEDTYPCFVFRRP